MDIANRYNRLCNIWIIMVDTATASIGYIEDFIEKVRSAGEVDGPSYIHVIAPCPTGWGIPVDETINAAKQVVDCGLWYLAEYYDGEFHLNRNPNTFTKVESYLRSQARFKHLEAQDIQHIIEQRDKKWNQIRSQWC